LSKKLLESILRPLDLFGQGSLFQWINICHTDFGRKELKNMLTLPAQPSHQCSPDYRLQYVR